MLTKGQRDFLNAIFEEEAVVFHRRVVDPMVKAGLAFPRPGNVFYFIAGCQGHSSAEFYLTRDGHDELLGQQRLPL